MKKIIALGGVLAVLVATGCTTTGNDAGVQRVHGDRSVVDMPDGYNNLSSACIAGMLVIVDSGGNIAWDDRHAYHICDGRRDGAAPQEVG